MENKSKEDLRIELLNNLINDLKNNKLFVKEILNNF
jgi:hypothetical protein